MSKINITINNILCEANEGDYILNVARENNIFIPAICYLADCSPTLACRLCMADIDGKRVYTCSTKVKDGQNIVTNSQEIEDERKSIMEVYAINHPLECGVCDKSGECELQNYALLMGVNEQKNSVLNSFKKIKHWGLITYDPSLCIVCERCITVCKDKIGEKALKLVPRGEEFSPSKEAKETMSKDSFGVWNKMQKSIIDVSSPTGELDCSFCGECTCVCPVGALGGTTFHYSTNSWELTKIPASNPHSSDCSLIYYEVKQHSIEDSSKKIYRVTNDFEFSPINGAARYGYSYSNKVTKKDESSFKKVIDFIKNEAKIVRFNSFITNEEAFILEKIREKYALKLINEDAKRYQRFLDVYSKVSGKTLYEATLKDVKNADFIISIGSFLRSDSPNSSYALNSALLMNKANAIYAHPINDNVVNAYSKNILQLNYQPSSEEALLYILVELFCKELSDNTKEYLDSFKYEIKITSHEEKSEETFKTSSKLWDLICVDDCSDKIKELSKNREKLTLLVGEDILTNPNWNNLALLVGLLSQEFKVLIIPSSTNSLGVSQICTLDEKFEEKPNGKVLGYNENGDMKLCALGMGDLDMPTLNQQEGTFTNIDKQVVPTNAALPYFGYTLNDIANALGICAKYTISYTKELPIQKGYKVKDFDDLPNHFDNGGAQHRGYLLENINIKKEDILPKEIKKLAINENIIYMANPILQFNSFTNRSKELHEEGALYVSPQFREKHELKDGEVVCIISKDNESIKIKIKEDKNISGLIVYIPTFDENLDVSGFFKDGYRFSTFTLSKGA